MNNSADKGERLFRDNIRFKFLSDEGNKKAELPENCTGIASTEPVLMQIARRQLKPGL